MRIRVSQIPQFIISIVVCFYLTLLRLFEDRPPRLFFCAVLAIDAPPLFSLLTRVALVVAAAGGLVLLFELDEGFPLNAEVPWAPPPPALPLLFPFMIEVPPFNTCCCCCVCCWPTGPPPCWGPKFGFGSLIFSCSLKSMQKSPSLLMSPFFPEYSVRHCLQITA